MFDFFKRLKWLPFSRDEQGRLHWDKQEVGAFLNQNPLISALMTFCLVSGLMFFSHYTVPVASVYEFERSVGLLAISVALMPMYWLSATDLLNRNKHFLITWGTIMVQLMLITVVRLWLGGGDAGHKAYIILLTPYIFAPLLVSVLLGVNLGMFAAVASTLMGFFFVSSDYMFPYLVTSSLAGMLTVFITNDFRNRGQLLRAGFVVGLMVLFLALLFGQINVSSEPIVWDDVLVKGGMALGTSIALSILLSGLLPLIEATCRTTTPMAWMELSDMNHKLIKRLQLEAPGTFHHCLMVAQLAEAAAESIGANALECRVCAYYHDIGKLNAPYFFAENIQDMDKSVHKSLSPAMSARRILQHVSDGIVLAKEHNLHKRVIDTIRQHHGDSLVYFFYYKALEQRETSLAQVGDGLVEQDDLPEVKEEYFRYAGPRPSTREIALVSLADVVESATRSLVNSTKEELENMIDDLLRKRVIDGLLDDSGLSFGELKRVRNTFVSTIKSMRHTRVVYPTVAITKKGNGVNP